MSQTNDWKEEHFDEFLEWVSGNKFGDVSSYALGNNDPLRSYERTVQAYISDNADKLWEEYSDTLEEASTT